MRDQETLPSKKSFAISGYSVSSFCSLFIILVSVIRDVVTRQIFFFDFAEYIVYNTNQVIYTASNEDFSALAKPSLLLSTQGNLF